ncbi:MAG: hypothetical protein WBA31_01535 [Candidatus Dormiibacterota bacterium]
MGEQLGLAWADIDFEHQQLHVRHSLRRIEAAYVLVEPKSTTSRRVVDLIPQAAMAAAGVPRMRWHDRRALHGGLLLLGGTDISTVSKMLGHSAIGVTPNPYAGVSDVLGRKASGRLAALFSHTV